LMIVFTVAPKFSGARKEKAGGGAAPHGLSLRLFGRWALPSYNPIVLVRPLYSSLFLLRPEGSSTFGKTKRFASTAR